MHWLQKRLGLKLFVACWLLVLLIPNWREDAREQWGNETWSFDSPIGESTSKKTALLASRFPDDWAAQLEALNAHDNVYTFSTAATQGEAAKPRLFEAYAQLSRRFPRENEIRKAWLRDVTRGGLDIDVESAYAHPSPQKRPKKQENWLPKVEIEAAIAAAREGAKIEPQNSFFPWMESALHFALKRPSDALAALERAAGCAFFDDGTTQTVRRRLELLGRVQNVGWGDKSRAMWSLLLPHLGKMSAIASAAMKISGQVHRRGEKVRALHIAATVARAAATLSNSQGTIAVWVGDEIQQIAWHGALKNAGRDIESPRFAGGESLMETKERLAVYQSHSEDLARTAAAYARELNQEPIAKQALNTLPHLKGRRLAASYQENAFNGTFRDARRLAKAFWLQSRLLRFSLVSAVLWVVAFALTFRAALPADLKRTMAVWAAFCVGATAVLLGVGVVYFGLGSTDGFFLDDGERVSSYALEYARNLSGLVVLLWSFPVIVTALLNAVKDHAVKRPRLTLEKHGFSAQRMVKILIYGVMSVSVATFFFIVGYAPSGGSDWERIAVALLFVFGASVVAAGVFHAATTSGNQRIAAILVWAVPWLLLSAMAVRESFYGTVWVVLILAIALVFVGLSAHLTNWRPAPLTLRFFFEVLARARVLAATLAVASAIFYLGVRIGVLPEEARMNALIDTQLKIGEVAWLEERLKR